VDHSLGENGEVEGGAWARLRRLTKRQRSIGLEREEGTGSKNLTESWE